MILLKKVLAKGLLITLIREVKMSRIKNWLMKMEEDATDMTVREYDNKTLVWKKMFLPSLVNDYEKIKTKVYCDPYFWIIIDVIDDKTTLNNQHNNMKMESKDD
jgi:hypothetical protein